MKQYFTLFAVFIAINLPAQEKYNPNAPPNTYRHADNPLYWKNRKPFADYWQQDVYYRIQARIDEKTNIIDAAETLTYWNNSPDTLYFVYFHLYQNAFQPESYYTDLTLNNNVKPNFGKYESKKLGTVVEKIEIISSGDNTGYTAETHLDNTILKVSLQKPLLPNHSIDFNIKFKTYFDTGSMRRRMKMFYAYGYKHFDGVHWYPRIAVYDRKFGWETEQHLEKEFYGDYGTYQAELNFANNYVVEATGTLQNREEVLPDTLRKKLDISNFKDKPLESKPSVIIPYDTTQRKTWKYYAENVHDFAFTADPAYRIGESEWNGIKCIAVCQEPHAAKWQNAAEYTAKIIKTYSEDFGRYAYPKMVVADARDGMEYPMLTLDGGLDPGYRGLFAHEIAHNWFFGMVGNNETYRAFLDEGFTSYLTNWALEKIDGKYPVANPADSWYKRKFNKPIPVREGTYNRYMNDVVKGMNPPLNTHSADFGGALRHGGGYGHVYHKTVVMLNNLQYVMGDTLFQHAMKHYFNQWKFCHPYPEDFRNAIIRYSKADLNWFFDEWIEASKTIDYGIQSVRKGEKENEYKIKLVRKGEMQMPVDLQVVTADGQKYNYHIPNTWFVKETNGATVLPKWFGWNKIQKAYTANVTVPGKIKDVIIDPSHRLADVNMLDNSKKRPLQFSFDSQLPEAPHWDRYVIKWRPDIWFNAYDGIKAGLHLNGNYMNYKRIFRLTTWWSTGAGQGGLYDYNFGNEKDDFNKLSFIAFIRTPADQFIPGAAFYYDGKMTDGLSAHTIGFEAEAGENDKIYIHAKSMIRPTQWDLNYLLYPNEWQPGKWNHTLNAGYDHYYRYFKGYGYINLHARNSAFNSDYNFGNLSMTVINRTVLGKWEINTRTFVQYGYAKEGAGESALFLAGANPEQLMDNKFTRSAGFVPKDWTGNYEVTTNHFQQGGGLNLRGYAGYYAVESDNNGELYTAYKGNSGAAVNVEIDFDEFIRFRPGLFRNSFSLDAYVFADAGAISYEDAKGDEPLAPVRMDAGIGAALTIKRFWKLETVEPLTIRFDMPFFLNRTPFAEPDYFKLRWVAGIGRSF